MDLGASTNRYLFSGNLNQNRYKLLIIKYFLSNSYTYIQTGRKKKYQTIEEKKSANNATWKRWYEKNKEKLNTHRMERYYDQKRKKEMDQKMS